MGQMLVRNLDDAVIEKLKRKALERGTSLEQVAREALTAAATTVGFDRAAWVARADALRAQCPRSDVSSVELIREMRDDDRMTRLMDEWEREKGPRDTL
jgi:antitoxin FitA